MTIGRERALVMAAVVALVAARSSVFLLWEQAAFDSDQAIVGLMAKHLAEGRAFPLFFYGQNYLLAVEAWMAAPLFWLPGPSVAALKLPLLALNVGVAALLVRLIEREMGLRPFLAGLASVFFVLASPGIANQLVTALGVSVEPFLYNLFCDPDIIDLPLAFLFRRPLARFIARTRAPKVRELYKNIGGKSPILKLTKAQAEALERELRKSINANVYIAMRYWHPMTEEAVERVYGDNVQQVILLPLYPHYSRSTTGSSVNGLQLCLRSQ